MARGGEVLVPTPFPTPRVPKEAGRRAWRQVAGWVGLALAGLCAACGAHDAGHHRAFPPLDPLARPSGPEVAVDDLKFEVPPPPFRDPDVFPCSECHDNKDLKSNPTRRTLQMAHEDIVLHHDEQHRWCLDCHDAEDRDKLRLANGTLVEFQQSYRLCGQCHGDKYRDWRAGVHGRRVGSWSGEKQYLLCVHCHWSHEPRFPGLLPEPAPTEPGRIR